MADINLLSTNNESRGFRSKGAPLFVKILSVLLLLVVLYYGYLWFYSSRIQNQITEWKDKTAQVQAQAMNQKERKEVVTRQGQIQNLDQLIKNHVSWSYLLPELARVTLKSAVYSSISADEKGSLTLTVTAPNYADLDKYLQVFDLPQYNQQFSEVRILSINKIQNEDRVYTQMKIQLKFNPDFIRNRLSNAQ
jgi:hypothetical protein